MELSVGPQLLPAQQEGKVVYDGQAVGSQRHLRALQLPPHLRGKTQLTEPQTLVFMRYIRIKVVLHQGQVRHLKAA